jgi:hypothetical protein
MIGCIAFLGKVIGRIREDDAIDASGGRIHPTTNLTIDAMVGVRDWVFAISWKALTLSLQALSAA